MALHTHKAGTEVTVTFRRPGGDVVERAVVCRVTKAMRPLPAGYVPVRFVADRARLLVYASALGA